MLIDKSQRLTLQIDQLLFQKEKWNISDQYNIQSLILKRQKTIERMKKKPQAQNFEQSFGNNLMNH